MLTRLEYLKAVLAACGGKWPYPGALAAADRAYSASATANTPEQTAQFLKDYAARADARRKKRNA